MLETVRRSGSVLSWIDRVRAWFVPIAPVRRIEFTAPPAADPVWPQEALAAVAAALARAMAEAEVPAAPVSIEPTRAAVRGRPLAAQLAMQARRNVPKGREPRPMRAERTTAKTRAKPVRAAAAPKRRAAPPPAWIQARRATRR